MEASARRPIAADLRRIRAIVVDDQADQRRMAEFMLLAKGFDVTATAADGIEGLAAIRSGRPDVVVSDYQMPKSTGLDMVKALRNLPDFASLPVLIVTGSDDDGVAELRRMANVVVLAKPVSVTDLADAVDRLLIEVAESQPAVELTGRRVRPLQRGR